MKTIHIGENINMVVSISGNIGSGKSTLCRLLAECMGWEPYLEQVENCPFIKLFYQDMHRWGLASQIWFLNHRIARRKDMGRLQHGGVAVFDRAIYEDQLFARNLFETNLLTTAEYNLYMSVFNNYLNVWQPPHLLVYLKASINKLRSHITKRGREYERLLQCKYLRHLDVLYDEWISQFDLCPVVTVSMDMYDFVENPNDLSSILSIISNVLYSSQITINSPRES